MARVRTTALTAGIRGSVGDATFVQGATGTQLRRRPVRVGPPTPAQREAALRMERISAWWAQVDLAGVEAWRAYALSLEAMRPVLERQPVSSWNAFLALATRVLMIDPRADVPLLPPAAAFAGDAVAVSVGSPSPDGSFGRGGWGERLPEPPPPASISSYPGTPSTWETTLGDFSQDGLASPPSADPPTVPPFVPQGEPSSGVLYRASRANAPGVVTELMLQRLASVARAPVPSRYRSQGFVAFAEGGLEAAVPQAPGWVACAHRFVDAGTGQATAVFPCGIVSVR